MKTRPYFNVVVGNERGVAMIVAMLVLIILTVIGIASSKTAVYDTITAVADKRKRTAFYAAEAGLEHAKAVIASYTMPMLSATDTFSKWKPSLLHGATTAIPNVVFLKDITVGSDKKYKYTVYVRNNNDGGGPSNDVDGEIVLRSESSSTIEGGGKAIVEAIVSTQSVDMGVSMDKTGQFGHGQGKGNTNNDAVMVDTSKVQTTGIGVPGV